jgi:hypothetical protein
MSQSHLVACPSCARHVRVSESACPFCRAGLTAEFRSTPARQAPRARLTRAALFVLGTGVALTPACSSSSSGSPGGSGEELGDGASEPETGSGGGADGGSAADTGGGASTDAGAGTDATPSDAAGEEDAFSAQPLYGAVAHDGGGYVTLYGGFAGH